MGGHAEYTAKKAGITRQEQDEFSALSHRKRSPRWKAEVQSQIVSVVIPARKGPTTVDTDEGRERTDRDAWKIASGVSVEERRERWAFGDGGNASSLNDGAAALVVVGRNSAPTGVILAKSTRMRQSHRHKICSSPKFSPFRISEEERDNDWRL
jgi:acetyl-CoA C-acetyltransferase